MKYLLTLVITYAIYNAGCTMCSSKKVTCPAFNEPEFSKWFPYKLNDTLHFINQTTSDTVTYAIGYYQLSETYETQQGGYSGNVANCGSHANIYGYAKTSAIGQFVINYITDGNNSLKQLYVAVLNGLWNTGEIVYNTFKPSPVNNSPVSISQDSAYKFINGVTYSNFITIANDTTGTKEDKPYKLYIAKNTGIVGFEMYPSKQKWVLQ